MLWAQFKRHRTLNSHIEMFLSSFFLFLKNLFRVFMIQEKMSFLLGRMRMLLVTVLRYVFSCKENFYFGGFQWGYWSFCTSSPYMFYLMPWSFQYVIRELPSSPVPASCCKALLQACRKFLYLYLSLFGCLFLFWILLFV